MRDDLTIVVSPLVSLMQDQVEALERAVPGRAALVNAQQDAVANREAVARASGGRRCKLLYVAPERFASPGFLEALRDVDVGLFVVDEAHCVSQWGHDFRPDYFRLADAARWLGARAIVASTATATPQVADDIAAPPRACATRCASRPASTARTSPSPSSRAAARPTSAPASPRRWRARPRGRRSSTRARARRPSGSPPTSQAALGIEVVAYHAGLAAGGARDRPAPVHGRRGRGRRGDERVRDGRRQGRRADGRARERARLGRGLLPGGRPRGPRRRAGPGAAARRGRATRACTSSSSSARRSTTPPSRRSPTASARPSACSRSARPAGRSTSASASSATIPSACARSSATSRGRAWSSPRPRPSDRLRGRLEAPFDGARAGGVPRVGGRGASARAGASTARCGRSSRAAAAAGATLLRHFGDRASRRRPVPCCDVCAPGLVPEAPAAAGGAWAVPAVASAARSAHARPRRRDPRRSCRRAAPAVGRTRAVEILRGGRSKALRRHGYDGLPGYGAFGHLPAADVLARVDALLAMGRLASTGGAVSEAPRRRRRGRREGRRSSPRARARTCRRCSTPCTAARSRSSRSPPTSRRRGRSSARAARAWPSRVFARADYADRADARRGDGRLARGARRRARRPRGLHGDPRRRLPRALRRADRQRPPVAAARVPRRAGDRAGARLRGEGLRRDRPLRRAGRGGHRPDDPAGRGRGCRRRRTPADVLAALRPLEHALLPRAVALIAAGAVRRDPRPPAARRRRDAPG